MTISRFLATITIHRMGPAFATTFMSPISRRRTSERLSIWLQVAEIWCGYGRGYSVLEVLSTVQSRSTKRFDVRRGPRRSGDPPMLVADSTKLRGSLRWQPRLDNLDAIVRTALDWERRSG